MEDAAAIDMFSALAQPTRLAIFKLLVTKAPADMPALDIGKTLDVVPSTLSGHLSILKNSGILSAERHQREIRYRVNLSKINDLLGFLVADCCGGDLSGCCIDIPAKPRNPS